MRCALRTMMASHRPILARDSHLGHRRRAKDKRHGNAVRRSGTKRTCQNEECGARFYDLTHDPITCPSCQTVFVPPPDAKGKPTWKAARNVPRHTIVAPAAVEDLAEGETADLELAETAADAAAEVLRRKRRISS